MVRKKFTLNNEKILFKISIVEGRICINSSKQHTHTNKQTQIKDFIVEESNRIVRRMRDRSCDVKVDQTKVRKCE